MDVCENTGLWLPRMSSRARFDASLWALIHPPGWVKLRVIVPDRQRLPGP
jgi:hypothetical protein